MGESAKAVIALLMIVGIVAASLAWNDDRPDAATWGFRIGGVVTAVLALALLLKLQFRTDLAPDYLRERMRAYFNRDGFCFAFAASSADGIAYFDAYFQNQYSAPCVGRIVLRPARGFFLGRAPFEAITYEINCEPAGFGVASIPIPIPQKLQGKHQSFEVGASVDFPAGKGRRLRFRDGVFLRTNTDFGDAFGTALTAVGAATGTIVLPKPALAKVALPANVAEVLPVPRAPELKTFWRLGDMPLETSV